MTAVPLFSVPKLSFCFADFLKELKISAAEHLHRASLGSMSAFSGWRHLTTSTGGSSEARGGWKDGEAAQRGPAGPVDGKPEGSRMGEAGEVSYGDLIGFDYVE